MRIFFFKLLLISLLSSSFNELQAQTGSVEGVIIDEESKSSVEFATISLFNASDSSLVTGTITNSLGNFEIEGLNYGTYYSKVAFMGYKTKIIPDISITEEKPKHDLGKILLNSFSKNMDEFNVVAEKELVEIKIDKTVYNVSKDPASQGGNGLDALKNLPSVDVDIEDNISLRNDNSVTILIDGKPSPIPASQLLKNIPSSLIEKIEVITNPSAKYNPEGMSGIINIVLKKEKAVGFNANIHTGAGFSELPNRYNGSLNLNFRRKKINIYANTGFYKGAWGGKGVTNRIYTTNDSLFYQDLNFERESSYNGVWYSGGVDYYVDESNVIYLELDGWNGGGKGTTKNRYDFYDRSKVLHNYSNRITENENSYLGQDISLGWQSEFDEDGDHTLDVEVDFTKNTDEATNETKETYYLVNDIETGIPAIQNTNNPGVDYEFEGIIDYVFPITDSLELEAGFESIYTDASREFYSESNDTLNKITPDLNLNNEVTFIQNINAGYFTIGKQFKKVGIKFGSRFENVTTKIDLINTNEEFTKVYNSFFPSFYLTYKLFKNNELKLSYSRRINRPREWEINPFSTYTDPYSLSVGNPDLNPEYINVYELGYLFQGEKLTLTPSVYVRQVNDKKTRFSSVNNEGVVIATYNNLGKLTVTGVEFIARYSPFEWWRINGTINYNQSIYKDLNLEGASNSTINGWNFQYSSSFTFKKGLSLRLNGNYYAKNTSIQGTTLPRQSVGLGITKKILNDKGSVGVRVSDLFNTQEYSYIGNDLGGYSATTYNKPVSRTFYLSFHYSFGSIKMDDDRRRGGGSFNGKGSGGQGM